MQIKNKIEIGPLAQARIEEFLIYLRDHISDNGQHHTPLFVPISRKDLDLPKEMAESFRKGQALSIKEMGWRRIFVAENEQNKIVGHIDLRSLNQAYTRHRAIIGMGVDRDYRKLGLGSSLMETAITWAKEKAKLSYIDLQVLSENKPAIRLYEKLGFQRLGEMKDMFRIDGASHNYLLMVKTLS